MAAGPLLAQGPVTLPRQPLPDGPLVVDTAEEKIGVTVMKGLSHPWSLAFLPNGDMLVTERNAGRLRMIARAFWTLSRSQAFRLSTARFCPDCWRSFSIRGSTTTAWCI